MPHCPHPLHPATATTTTTFNIHVSEIHLHPTKGAPQTSSKEGIHPKIRLLVLRSAKAARQTSSKESKYHKQGRLGNFHINSIIFSVNANQPKQQCKPHKKKASTLCIAVSSDREWEPTTPPKT